MSSVNYCRCDGCGRVVENGHNVPGWLKISGSIVRQRGVLDGHSYQGAFVKADDFCSLDCLRARFDAVDEEDAAKASAKRLAEPSVLPVEDPLLQSRYGVR